MGLSKFEHCNYCSAMSVRETFSKVTVYCKNSQTILSGMAWHKGAFLFVDYFDLRRFVCRTVSLIDFTELLHVVSLFC